jgi:hypothetical protein
VSEPEDVQAAVLARALEATTRSAVAAEGAASDPLHDPALVALAEEALGDALGPPRTGSELFPMTVWQHGAGHVGKRSPGVQFAGTIDTFVATLRQRAEIVAAHVPFTRTDGQTLHDWNAAFRERANLESDPEGRFEFWVIAKQGRVWVQSIETLSALLRMVESPPPYPDVPPLAETMREMREDLQSSISYAGGRALADLKKVNYVILGGENAGEHLLM